MTLLVRVRLFSDWILPFVQSNSFSQGRFMTAGCSVTATKKPFPIWKGLFLCFENQLVK